MLLSRVAALPNDALGAAGACRGVHAGASVLLAAAVLLFPAPSMFSQCHLLLVLLL